jgi:hypothetical protein
MVADYGLFGRRSPAVFRIAEGEHMLILRMIAFAVLVFLPGAWVTFGLVGTRLRFSARLCGGAVLSPLVVCLQFYALRLLGLAFASTAALLPILNLPALYLILKQRGQASLPSGRAVAAWLLVLLIPLACFIPTLIDPQTRVFTGHAWLYSDPIYRMANGELLLTEPELVGFRLGYPWPGLVYQGILSYLLDSPPAVSYIWTNLVWLLIIFCLLAGIVAQLGGNRFSGITSVIWLCFAVNFVGFVVSWAATGQYDYPAFGDPRFTPWLLKFLFFEQEPLALGLFIAILYLLLRQQEDSSNRELFIVLTLMMCGLGLLYALYWPAAAGLIGAQAVAICFDSFRGRERLPWKHLLVLGACLLISGALTAAYVSFLGVDRVTSAVLLTQGQYWLWKPIASLIVTSPLLLGFCVVLRRSWPKPSKGAILLVLGGLSSLALYVVFYLPGFYNEYKYVLTAAVCLTPFAALALEPLFGRIGRRAYPVVGLAAIILTLPLGYRLSTEWPWVTSDRYRPLVDLRSFDLRLADQEKLARVCDAIRNNTPGNSVVVIREAQVHIPTLTGRQLYVPPYQWVPHAGVNVISADILTESRGYGPQVIEDRRRVLDALFGSGDTRLLADALDRILQFKRPVVIVAEADSSTALLDWLAAAGRGQPIYSGDGFVVWMVGAGHDG